MTRIASIVVDGLRIEKEGHVLLDNVSFAVQPGVVVGLIGPSGSGKTTLMRAIVGAQVLTGGRVTVLGQFAGTKVLRSKIGYVTQSPAIYTDLTVRQNLRYFATLAGASKAQIDEVLRLVHLDVIKDRLSEKLSGGERARVSLAIALLGDPEVLVLDEPTVGLDPILRRELWDLFSNLAKKGKTILVSSHVMDEAERCEQLLLLREGKLVWHGNKRELLKTTTATGIEEAFVRIINKEEVE